MSEILWKVKRNVGPHTHKKTRYLPGETFMGPATLGNAFSDKLEPANDAGVKQIAKVEDGGDIAALKVKHQGGGKYNVINVLSGKPINDELLSRAAAYALIAETENPEDKDEE